MELEQPLLHEVELYPCFMEKNSRDIYCVYGVDNRNVVQLSLVSVVKGHTSMEFCSIERLLDRFVPMEIKIQ